MSRSIGGAPRRYLPPAAARGCPIATGRDMFEAQTALAEQLFGRGR